MHCQTSFINWCYLEKLDHIGFLVNLQDFHGNCLASKESFPNIAIPPSCFCTASSQLYILEDHAFWIETGRPRQFEEDASMKPLNGRVNRKVRALLLISLQPEMQQIKLSFTSWRIFNKDCASWPRWARRFALISRSSRTDSKCASIAMLSIKNRRSNEYPVWSGPGC